MGKTFRKKWAHLEIELLEDRLAPAVYTVNTLADNLAPAGGGNYDAAGCSLRWAITNMNTSCRLTGNFPGSPVDLRFFFELEGDKIASLEVIP